VRQARAGVGARMRAEEEGWGQGRRRNELTRRLHRFVGELEVGALEWGAGQGGQAERVSGLTEAGRDEMRGVGR